MDENSPLQKNNNFGIAGKPLQPSVDANRNVYESLQSANTVIKPEIISSREEDIKELHEDHIVMPLRTYESDVAGAINNKQTSVIKIAMAEKRRSDAFTASPTEIRTEILLVALSIIFVLSGLTALGYIAYQKFYPAPQTVNQAPLPKIISVDATQKITVGSGQTIGAAIAAQQPKIIGTKNSITQVFFLNGTSTASQAFDLESFIGRLSGSAPIYMSQALSPNYIVGYQLQNSPEPFIIFKTIDYNTAYAGMLVWENGLGKDLFGLNPKNNGFQFQSNGKFQDQIIDNKNVRVLQDASGNTIAMYSFPDKQTLVITTNVTTLRELFSRLNQSGFVQ